MHLKWPKKIKYGALIVGMLITVGSLGMMIYEGSATHKVVDEKTVCTYQSEESLHYKVNMNSTKLYDEPTVAEGQYYVSNYADQIVFSYVNSYVASVKAEMTRQYKITTEFRGYAKEQGSEGEKKVTIWSKNEVVKEEASSTKLTDQCEINETIKLDLKKYSNFIKKLQKEENLFMPTEVIITIEGTQTVKLPKGIVEMPILATAVVPITEDYFKIDQQVGEKVDGKQVEEVVTVLPVNNKRMIVCAIVSFLGLIGCIGVGILVKDLDENKKIERKIKSIYMEYGSRIIHLEYMNKDRFKNIYQLSTLEDCIKLADELDKPILVETGEAVEAELLIIENQDLYIYKLEPTPKANQEYTIPSETLSEKVLAKVLEDGE